MKGNIMDAFAVLPWLICVFLFGFAAWLSSEKNDAEREAKFWKDSCSYLSRSEAERTITDFLVDEPDQLERES